MYSATVSAWISTINETIDECLPFLYFRHCINFFKHIRGLTGKFHLMSIRSVSVLLWSALVQVPKYLPRCPCATRLSAEPVAYLLSYQPFFYADSQNFFEHIDPAKGEAQIPYTRNYTFCAATSRKNGETKSRRAREDRCRFVGSIAAVRAYSPSLC